MAEPSRKRCLYEILGVSRDCSQEDVRSAYKRLALQLHPDKIAQSGGGGPAADATAAFQELLHAYEVLSDPKERTWYDSHRSQILFSDPSSASKSTPPSFGLDLFSFFSKSVYSGFSDSGKGFFKVYGDVFAKIYAQELYFTEQLGLSLKAVAPAPLIGNLESPYSQATAFYNYWLGFCTVMDFAWVDEYDSSAGPNRRSRRLMEEENKKLRKKARREYNDTVRGLAAFVKKRDKRILDMQTKKSMEEGKRRAEEMERKKAKERKKMEKLMMYEEPDWSKVDNEDSVWDCLEDDKGKNKGKDAGELYCVVCSKKFKSDKQWKNHEQSKKHRDKVTELQASFKEEDEAMQDVGEKGLGVSFDYEPPPEEEGSETEQLCRELEDDLVLAGEENDNGNAENTDTKSETDDESSVLDAMISRRRNRKKGYMNTHDLSANAEVAHPPNNERDHMVHQNQRENSGTDQSAELSNFKGELDGSQQVDVEVQFRDHNSGEFEEQPTYPVDDISDSKGNQGVDRNNKSKKQHSIRKEPTKKDAPPKNPSRGNKHKVPSNSCETCGESFDSRNKLFAHLGKTGHAMLKSR
ncbi:hypothetical protein HPP92_009477 [Vanilla planifolia]|uniref:Uncharacterized protein n=1 Tax=Vanilla planifolia TaxID=51239 RepID=A0A835R7Y6_VANPL|nr:hypothetical protein HPP92_009477 [Vanilla planifolia]